MCSFNGVLAQKQYDNFMLLCVACHIFLRTGIQIHGCIAKKMMELFVKTFSEIYGSFLISHNVHGLLHVYDDFINFGTLDMYITFPFENFLQELKRTLRKKEKPLEQIIRRHSEGITFLKPQDCKFMKNKFHLPHTDGPVLESFGNVLQFRMYISTN